MINKRTVLVSLVFGLVASLLFLGLAPRGAQAAGCPAGETLVRSAIAANGNSLVVCQSSYAGGTLDWYVFNSIGTQLNSSGQTGATLQGLYATPDSKFLLVINSPYAGGTLDWYIYGANGLQLNSSGQTGATLQGVAMTNDGKIAFVYYSNYAGGTLGWDIYGSNGTQTDSSGMTGGVLRRVWATNDNKLHVEICSSNTVSTYNYGVSGTLESTVAGGPCSSVSVGGIAEAPDVKALPQELAQSPGNDFAPFAIGGAAAAALIVLGTGTWFLRRRRSTR